MAVHTRRELQFNQDECAYFLSLAIENENGCLIYDKNKTATGYANFAFGGGERYKQIIAIGHRAVYLWHKGAIPIGWDIDHMCHNEAVAKGECDGNLECPHRACVNPDHLRAVPHSENISAGSRMSYRNRTICNNGHDLELWARKYAKIDSRYKSGKVEVSYCKQCNNISQREVRKRKKMQNA